MSPRRGSPAHLTPFAPLLPATPSAAIRRATVACEFVPVFIGSAFKNKGVQPLLDGVVDYLPSPEEKENHALDLDKEEEQVKITCDADAPLVALAFKLEEGKFGQLTYMRVYQGTLKRGMNITNVNSGKKIKVPRIVRMHSDDMEDIESAGAGEVSRRREGRGALEVLLLSPLLRTPPQPRLSPCSASSAPAWTASRTAPSTTP